VSYVSSLLLALPALVVLLGCSALRQRGSSDACLRSVLDPAPVWTAGASWDLSQNLLLLLDPGSRALIAFSLDGTPRESLELDRLADLDYSVPLRFEALDDGYVLGDPSQILWLDRSLGLVRRRSPFKELQRAGVHEGRLNDFVAAANALLAYADFATGDDGWRRGLIRIDLAEGSLEPLFELSLEDPEFAAYYHYDLRPYIVNLGRHAFFLRFSDPPQLLRIRGSRLERVAELADPELQPVSLHPWEDRLFILSIPKQHSPLARPATLGSGGEEPSRVSLRMASAAQPRLWLLQEIDPASGELLGRYRLPTDAQRLRLVPGRARWAMIEETFSPNVDDEEGGEATYLKFLPASWFRPRLAAGAPEVTLQCP
jgi:hypothetical protein